MHVDPNSPAARLTKRQQEVLERLERGQGAKQIARDIGVSRAAVYQHIERLRKQGALAESYTPSGQPPRRPLEPAPARAAAPRDSAVAELRRQARAGAAGGSYAEAIEGAIASADAAALAYELGRLDALGESGLPLELVESALRRLSVLPGRETGEN
jgi:DNA-binding CsgD family transcriptional regulator